MTPEAEAAVQSAVRDLVRLRNRNGIFYVSLPLVCHEGSSVTVRVDQTSFGFRVSDAGFAFREVEDMGAGKVFTKTAKRFAEALDVHIADRILFTDVTREELERGIMDVGLASWRTIERIAEHAFDDDEGTLSSELTTRLTALFGEPNVKPEPDVLGQSTTSWPMTAVVTQHGHSTVFQAVSAHPHSINKAATAFHDISRLDSAPKIVAFVRSKAALGTKLTLLAPARVIEAGQDDGVLERASAA
ncbi:hypothetical protein [Bosea sp. (in: a-proteobacteria)]|uniref:hypothetical protein n=1 Tax=Bosea sp. (in: a-proteobacteria) TaxID=1871050 RepID=UPI002734CBD1|nr:hypothetical protein [Bosea sp. (in: a-proteobacteria)]MDP3410927.1 hypothetical protein [Bosea sp. (in: a-proteobacteria)]